MKVTLCAKILAITTCAILFASTTQAQITVDGVIVHLAANQRPVHNVTVGNSSEHAAYAVVQVEEFVDPANPTKTVPSSDLLASPKAFSVEANGSRTVRLLLKTPPQEKERVFRVSFVPQDHGFGQEIEKNVGGHSTVIRVLTGMGILVFCDPANPHSDLSWERGENKLTFTNKGNVNVYLSEGQACLKPAEGNKPGENCQKLDSKRIYGGSNFEVKVPSNLTVTYLRQAATAGEFERLTIPPAVK